MSAAVQSIKRESLGQRNAKANRHIAKHDAGYVLSTSKTTETGSASKLCGNSQSIIIFI